MLNILMSLLLLICISCGKDDEGSSPKPNPPSIPDEPTPKPDEPVDPCLKQKDISMRLINGKVVPRQDYPEVILISSGGARCTATIVGPKTVITAAHCAKTHSTISFTFKGVKHNAKVVRSKIYPKKDHDIALAFSSKEFKGACPYTIGGAVKKGDEVEIFGYGCTRPGGFGGMDGKLRYGRAKVTGFSGYDFVSGYGAALCFGDSGGPAFLVGQDEKRFLIGVNSKGNIKNTNYNTRTDTETSRLFLEMMAKEKGVDICGINKNCP